MLNGIPYNKYVGLLQSRHENAVRGSGKLYTHAESKAKETTFRVRW